MYTHSQGDGKIAFRAHPICSVDDCHVGTEPLPLYKLDKTYYCAKHKPRWEMCVVGGWEWLNELIDINTKSQGALTHLLLKTTHTHTHIYSGACAIAVGQEFPPHTLSFEVFARKPGRKGVVDVSNKFLEDYLKPHHATLVRCVALLCVLG